MSATPAPRIRERLHASLEGIDPAGEAARSLRAFADALCQEIGHYVEPVAGRRAPAVEGRACCDPQSLGEAATRSSKSYGSKPKKDKTIRR